MQFLNVINIIFGAVFALCYGYQFFYLAVAYLVKKKKPPRAKPSRLAIIIAARNEEAVISSLLDSLAVQDYPKDFYSVFVVADNCTDNTASIASERGAIVYERKNNELRGKGYAIDYLLSEIARDFGEDFFDGFVMFDADNTAERNYLTEINDTFALGADVVTSYRIPSNYGTNIRTAGQGMFFLREMRVLNMARSILGTNTYVMGTGFLFSNKLRKQNGGWPFHLLTEDGEFTMDNAVKGVKCDYAPTAIFYDEQASKKKDSQNQKKRWCKGGLQIIAKYYKSLIRGLFSKKFLSCFDTMTSLTAAYFLTVIAVATNVIVGTVLILLGENPLEILLSFAVMATVVYFMLTVFSVPVTISEWKRLRATSLKKIAYAFTFPLYLFSFVPAAFIALFKRVEWREIKHGKK